jgi:hypothetical protein
MIEILALLLTAATLGVLCGLLVQTLTCFANFCEEKEVRRDYPVQKT